MQTRTISASPTTAGMGKFASPSEEIFADGLHVGTTYKWDDGLETTIWFSEPRLGNMTVSKINAEKSLGWHEIYASEN